MDSNIIMLVVIAGFGLFAGAMFAYRKVTALEPFDPMKFLPMMGYGAIAALVLYMAAGTIPGVDAIFAYIEILAPGGAAAVSVIIAALLTIINGFMNITKPPVTANLVGEKKVAAMAIVTDNSVPIAVVEPPAQKVLMANGRYAVIGTDPSGQRTFTYDDGMMVNCAGTVLKPADVVTPVVTPVAPKQVLPDDPNVKYSDAYGPGYTTSGFKVDPSDNKGISPFTLELRIEVGMSRDGKTRPTVRIDWRDGTPEETVAVRPADGVAWVKHLYTYVKGKEDKYFAKQIYPTFSVVDAFDGTVTIYNLIDGKRCCWIWVEDHSSVPQE